MTISLLTVITEHRSWPPGSCLLFYYVQRRVYILVLAAQGVCMCEGLTLSCRISCSSKTGAPWTRGQGLVYFVHNRSKDQWYEWTTTNDHKHETLHLYLGKTDNFKMAEYIYIYTFLMETVRQYGLEISDRQINSAEESQDVNIWSLQASNAGREIVSKCWTQH